MDAQSTCVCKSSRLSACALGVSLGVLSVIWVVVLGLVAMYLNVGQEWVKLAGTVYVGYAATFVGIALGALWAFVDGFVCGVLIAFFYNLCAKCCHCKSCCGKDDKTVA